MGDGTRVDLRHTLSGGWNLKAPDSRPLAAIRMLGFRPDKARVTLRSLPSGVVDLHIVVLTACAVASLEGAAGARELPDRL